MLLSYFIIGEESVKELQRKRHSATPGVSIKGRVRKVAKWKPASDGESDEESDSEFTRHCWICCVYLSTTFSFVL